MGAIVVSAAVDVLVVMEDFGGDVGMRDKFRSLKLCLRLQHLTFNDLDNKPVRQMQGTSHECHYALMMWW